jgi:large subunit ribosomal protein L31
MDAEHYRLRDFLTRAAQPYDWLEAGSADADLLLVGVGLVDVHCSSCGTSFTTRSTATTISVDVCSACHPAYTGRERTTVGGGRVERFNQRRALAA